MQSRPPEPTESRARVALPLPTSLAGVLVALAGLACGAAGLVGAPSTARAQEDEPRAGDTPAAVPADEAAVRTFLERARQVALAGPGSAWADLWDWTELVSEVLDGAEFEAVPAERKRSFRMGFAMGLRKGMSTDSSLLAHERMEVRAVRLEDGGERALAVARGWDADGIGLTWRLWLRRRGETWRLCDAEEISQGLRISRMASTAASGAFAEQDIPAWLRVVPRLVEVTRHAQRGEWEEAAAGLRPLQGFEFPADFEAVRWLMTAAVRLQLESDAEGALDALALALEQRPDGVAAELLRSRALLELGRHDEVLDSTARYLAVIGRDATACLLRAQALEALGRHAAALESFADAAADCPGVEELTAWMVAAHDDELDAPLAVFAALPAPEVMFEPLLASVSEADDLEALDRLLARFAEMQPDNRDLAYWRAVRCWELADVDGAKASLLPALRAFREEDAFDEDAAVDGTPWLELWCDLHDETDSLRAAYAPLAGCRAALLAVAERMQWHDDADGLEWLVGEHGRQRPEEPWLRYLQAVAHATRSDHEKAEEVLAALAKEDLADAPGLAEAVATRRAAVYARLGRALAGYDLLGPGAFADIADALVETKDGEALLALAARHGERCPDDELAVVYSLHGLLLAGRPAEAVKLFEGERATFDALGRFGDLVAAVRAYVRSGDIDGARALATRVRADLHDSCALAIVTIVAGDVEAARNAVLECLDENGYHASSILDDPDAGPPLAKEPMAAVRALLEERRTE